MNNFFNKYFRHFLRILTGLIFILSAYLKLFPIEPFELYIYGHPFINWSLASLLAVTIVGIEFALGLLLIVNVFPKKIQWFTLSLLSAFTIYLLFQALKGSTENCHCFGGELELGPVESIIKNLILIFILILLLVQKNQIGIEKWSKLIFTGIIIFGLAMPFILRPPDFIYRSYYSKGYSFSNEIDFTNFNFEDEFGVVNANDGKIVLCFFSTGCDFCKLSAKKISILSSKLDVSDHVFFIFTGGNENAIKNFTTETNSTNFRNTYLPPGEFFPLSGKRLPSIYFIENGEIIKNFGYRGIF